MARGNATGPIPIEEIAPARNVQPRLAGSGGPDMRVYLAPAGEELTYDLEDGWIRVKAPTVHYRAMVVVERSSG